MNRWWYDGKRDFLDWIGLGNAEIHIHFGIATFLVLALLFRRYRHGLIFAWLGVFLAQTANEAMDAIDWIRWTGGVNWRDAGGDYLDTMFWPTVLAGVW